ncbi:MAG TPA: SMP-30/gluconolactonase/LRE family protein [Polyangiaceae bacterium]|jgi:hypothetical protein
MKMNFATGPGWTGILVLANLGLLGAACTSTNTTDTIPDGSTEASTPPPGTDAAAPDAGSVSVIDASPVDAGEGDATTPPDAALLTPVFLARTNAPAEGLWEITPSANGGSGTTGTPLVSSVLAGQLLATVPDGGATVFGTAFAADGGGASGTYALGITTDDASNVYYAVAAASASPAPSPGIYKLPPGGGAAAPFTLGSSVTPNMNFPNGLDFLGTKLFVADSEGAVYAIDASGKATVWSQDSSLAPNAAASSTTPACGLVPLAIGANGIAHDAKNVYVTNTDYGRLIAIPIAADGSAGTPAILKEDCASLGGADGLVIDQDGSFVIAVNAQDKIVRVTPAGKVTVLAAGAPLATPGSVLFDTAGPGGARRLLVTNTTFFSPADAGLSPGLLQIAIP